MSNEQAFALFLMRFSACSASMLHLCMGIPWEGFTISCRIQLFGLKKRREEALKSSIEQIRLLKNDCVLTPNLVCITAVLWKIACFPCFVHLCCNV